MVVFGGAISPKALTVIYTSCVWIIILSMFLIGIGLGWYFFKKDKFGTAINPSFGQRIKYAVHKLQM
jgi:hypothetical protein